jgi:hypothetical protein
MFLFATFLTTNTNGVASILQEFFKMIISIIDVIAIYLLMRSKIIERENKITNIGMGWALGESVLSRLLPLWFESTGLDFNWKYIQMSITSNINILYYLSLTTLIFVFTKKNKEDYNFFGLLSSTGVIFYLLIPVLNNSLVSNFKFFVHFNSWLEIILNLFLISIFTFFASIHYSSDEKKSN